MLRYFYLLCLLVCIDWSFCYEYIPEHQLAKRRANEIRMKRHRYRDRARKAYEDEVEDKNSLAHIDLASFIQQPDYDSVMTNYYKPRYTERELKKRNYDNIIALGSIKGMSMHLPQMYEKEKRRNTGHQRNFARRNHTNCRQERSEIPEDKTTYKYEKKRTIKQMVIPFFSHKKTVTPKLKKAKKKKLSSSTNGPVLTTSSIKLNDIRYFGFNNNNIMKRSYKETYCPLCKRKLVLKLGKSEGKQKNKIIHNSRQFYQNEEEKAKGMFNRDIQNGETERTSLDADSPGKQRRKRNEKSFERERQLKELQEVEKRIDSVEIIGIPATQKGVEDKDKDKEETR